MFDIMLYVANSKILKEVLTYKCRMVPNQLRNIDNEIYSDDLVSIARSQQGYLYIRLKLVISKLEHNDSKKFSEFLLDAGYNENLVKSLLPNKFIFPVAELGRKLTLTWLGVDGIVTKINDYVITINKHVKFDVRDIYETKQFGG